MDSNAFNILKDLKELVDHVTDQADKLFVVPASEETQAKLYWRYHGGPLIPEEFVLTPNLLFLLIEAIRVTHDSIQAHGEFPPVTAALVCANILAFLRPGGYRLGDVSLNSYMVLKQKQYRRLFSSAFVHHNAEHLLNNMILLTSCGSRMERRTGSARLARLVVVLTCLSQSLYVLLTYLESKATSRSHRFYREALIGFSGVGFALQVVDGHECGGEAVVYGCRIPAKYACWASLALTQSLVPSSSFTGHISGIAAGLMYIFAPMGVRDALRYLHHLRTGQPARPDQHSAAQHHRFMWRGNLTTRPVATWSDLITHSACAGLALAVSILARRAIRAMYK